MAASPLDDMKKVILALPRMPKAIVDDTRHEKVLSYTSAFISQSSPELYHTMLDQWQILKVLQDCTASDQDHRVSGVAMRILGVLLEHDPSRNNEAAVWHQLETRYPYLLDYLIESNSADEALLRYSSWSALQHVVRYTKGAQWILNTGKCPSMIRSAFKDTSNFVIVETCHFLVALINNAHLEPSSALLTTAFREEGTLPSVEATPHDNMLRSLLVQVPLCSLMQDMVSNQASERDRLNGLEFLWMVTAARSPQSLAFLKQSRLLNDIVTVLMDDSRLVRARALDVLAILLDTASDPLSLITNNDSDLGNESQQKGEEPLKACVDYLLDDVILSLLLQTQQLKAWHVAVGTILSTLLWVLQAFQQDTRADIGSSGATTIVIEGDSNLRLVQELNAKRYLHQEVRDAQKSKKRDRSNQSNGSNGNGQAGVVSRVLPKTVVLSALKAVQNIARLNPESVEHSSLALEGVLLILFNDSLRSDQRVFKTCLSTLPILLKAKVKDGQLLDGPLFSKTMAVILDLIKQQDGSSTPLKLILEAVQEFFADQGLGRVLVHEDVGQQLAQRLQAKLYDMEWDVRDTVVEWIGGLFAEQQQQQQGDEDQSEGWNEAATALRPSASPSPPVSSSSHGVEWVLKYNLLESLFQKLTDEESYVRAACVHSFEQVMRHRRGWAAMSDPQVRLEERLSAQLPGLIRDSEAFVRRAVLDAMICLVKEREAGSVLLVNGTDLFVDAKFMSRLALDDADWEVRLRACRFLAAVWDHSRLLNAQDDQDSRNAARISKRARGQGASPESSEALTSNWWFYDIRGDEILIEATRDEARMVRAQSIAIVKQIKRQIELATPPDELAMFRNSEPSLVSSAGGTQVSSSGHDGASSASRKHGQDDGLASGQSTGLTRDEQDAGRHQHRHPHAAFYRALCELNFVRLDATASVEQLYEEVLNVERVEDVVMEESEQPNDGNNILDCY
ncbi:hypothetical protein BGW42_004051 [Actinomortierella wolfii]|nr:hypothetical protein BGW42_004051 [Actinomortierella wolfii]